MMSLRKRKNEVGPTASTYRVVTDQLDHQLGGSLVDRVASKFMSAVMRIYRGLRITKDRVATALDSAVMDPNNKKEREESAAIAQQLKAEEGAIKVMGAKMHAEMEVLRQRLEELPTEVLHEIAVSENVVLDPSEPVTEEGPDLDKQFSAGEEGAKKRQKMMAQEEKQHQKEISHQAREVISSQEDTMKRLKVEFGADEIVGRVRKLNKDVLPELQKKAKPEELEMREMPKGEAFQQFKEKEFKKLIDNVVREGSATDYTQEEESMGL